MNSWPSRGKANSAPANSTTAAGDDGQRRCHGAAQQRRDRARFNAANERVLAFLHAAGDGDGDQRRHQRQRQHEGRGQRDDHGQRHRLEHLAFDAGEGEQRHIDQDDDRLAVDAGLDHLLAEAAHRCEPLRRATAGGRARAAARPDAAGCSR